LGIEVRCNYFLASRTVASQQHKAVLACAAAVRECAQTAEAIG
jgi:hypothetical protein